MTPEEVQADLDTMKTQIPTLEELVFQQSLQHFNGSDQITANPAWSLFLAPFKCQVLSVAFFWEYWGIGGGDSTYWRLTLQKGNATVGWTDVAQRSTQNTGAIANSGISPRKAWTFDAAAWSDATLLPGQALRVAFAPFGSPAPITFPVLVAGRYTPVA